MHVHTALPCGRPASFTKQNMIPHKSSQSQAVL